MSAMASVWITPRATKHGEPRYRIEYRLAGRGSATVYGGSFKTLREANTRKAWISGEVAALRVPDIGLLAEAAPAPTIAEAARRWQESRVDVAESTRIQHRSSLRALLPLVGNRRVDNFTAADVADLVAELAKTRKKETIRKMIVHLAMIFDHEGVSPNPARGVQAAVRAEARVATSDGRACRGRAPATPAALPAAAAGAGRVRDEDRRTRGADLGRRGRAARPLARL